MNHACGTMDCRNKSGNDKFLKYTASYQKSRAKLFSLTRPVSLALKLSSQALHQRPRLHRPVPW